MIRVVGADHRVFEAESHISVFFSYKHSRLDITSPFF